MLHIESDQRLVGADVRGRLLAADVLLAGGERQHESALAVAVARLADQAAGNLAHELLARRHHAAVRSAESERHAERLRLHADDVGLRRRLHDAQRNRLGDRDDQQRAFLVDDLADRGDILNGAEEVRRLDQHAGGLAVDRLVERLQIDAAVLQVADASKPACPDSARRW